MSEFDPPRSTNKSAWLIAGICAVALHAGCVAFAMTYLTIDEPDQAMGSPAIEIGFVMTAPRIEQAALPPGPETEAAAASPALTEQKAVVKEADLPQAVPTETDDPDRLVTPEEAKKPKEEQEVAAAQTAASEPSVAVEATAMPSSEALPEAPRSVAVAQGTGESAQRIRAGWQKELMAHFEKFKRYPADRPAKNAEVVITFVLDRTGHVVSSSVVTGSGDTAFDQAALAMMTRADPVPVPPPVIADEGLSFTLPVVFRLRGR